MGKALQRRAKRAIERQLAYQRRKAERIRGREAAAVANRIRHAGDRLKQLFFKNAVYELIARRT